MSRPRQVCDPPTSRSHPSLFPPSLPPSSQCTHPSLPRSRRMRLRTATTLLGHAKTRPPPAQPAPTPQCLFLLGLPQHARLCRTGPTYQTGHQCLGMCVVRTVYMHVSLLEITTDHLSLSPTVVHPTILLVVEEELGEELVPGQPHPLPGHTSHRDHTELLNAAIERLYIVYVCGGLFLLACSQNYRHNSLCYQG